MRHQALLSIASVLGILLTLTATPAHSSEPTRLMGINFNESSVGTPITEPPTTGSAAAATSSRMITVAGGAGVTGSNPSSSYGRALRLPIHRELRASSPRAVLRVRNTSDTDALAVGDRDFLFGADFSLFADLGDDPQDGENLVQRGLWRDPAQWKLSVDGRKAQCMLGFGDRRVFTPVVRIPDGRWYRAICRRDTIGAQEARLTLVVRRWSGTRFEVFSTVSAARNAWGDLAFTRSTPMSVGGKLRGDGSVHPATDQFNGIIDRVDLRVG